MKEAEVRSLVRVEKEPSLDSLIISSDNLAWYLIARGFVARESQFAPRLDLSFSTPIVKDLYTERQEGFVLSEGDRTNLLRTAEWIRTEAGDKAGPVTKQTIQILEEIVSDKADVERSSVVFFDTKEKVIMASPINFGEFEKTTVSTLDILKEENIPMIEIHTHPVDSLFSSVDYSRILVDLWNGSPVVKSIMVLCPKIQVLALATRGTPLLDVDAVDELLEKLEEILDETSSIENVRNGKFSDIYVMLNMGPLEIARTLNIKLYSSTDMQHFKEFSA